MTMLTKIGNSHMKYVITKHSQQRRTQHKVINKKILIAMMYELDKVFCFMNLENGKYKIYHREATIIIAKKGETVTLITQRGIRYSYESNFDFNKLKIRILEE